MEVVQLLESEPLHDFMLLVASGRASQEQIRQARFWLAIRGIPQVLVEDAVWKGMLLFCQLNSRGINPSGLLNDRSDN